MMVRSLDGLYRVITLSGWDDPPRLLLDRFVTQVASAVATGSRVLDAGAGECRYASAFAHCRYVSCDTAVGDLAWDYTRLNVLCDVTAPPFRDRTFDAILCTQALEHVSEPLRALCELASLLKPGGYLYLSVPFLGDPLHQEPYDFYRYTPYGLAHLFRGAGLSTVTISPMGGLGFLLCCYLWFFIIYLLPASPRQPWLLRLLRRGVRAFLRLLARLVTAVVVGVDGVHRPSPRFTYGYTAIALKE